MSATTPDTLASLARRYLDLVQDDRTDLPDLLALADRFKTVLASSQAPDSVWTLEQLNDTKRGSWPYSATPDILVRIYSREHHAWWGPNGSGYAIQRDKAGIYRFSDAWVRSSHCGPEKGIQYEFLPNHS